MTNNSIGSNKSSQWQRQVPVSLKQRSMQIQEKMYTLRQLPLHVNGAALKISVSTIIACFIGIVSFAQTSKYDLQSLLNDKKLATYNRNVTLLNDGTMKGVAMNENSGGGTSWLTGATFSTGTIEVDLRGKDVLQKSFIGIAFHASNDSTYEAIYFRPFNFKATDPIRKIHAVQYISHPTFHWKKLRDEQNGVFEKALVNPPDPNGWFHARIEVSEENVVVYVNDDKVPSLTVKRISNASDGKIGLWVGEGSGGDFANLIITGKKL
jgi:hypothetical protein